LAEQRAAALLAGLVRLELLHRAAGLGVEDAIDLANVVTQLGEPLLDLAGARAALAGAHGGAAALLDALVDALEALERLVVDLPGLAQAGRALELAHGLLGVGGELAVHLAGLEPGALEHLLRALHLVALVADHQPLP